MASVLPGAASGRKQRFKLKHYHPARRRSPDPRTDGRVGGLTDRARNALLLRILATHLGLARLAKFVAAVLRGLARVCAVTPDGHPAIRVTGQSGGREFYRHPEPGVCNPDHRRRQRCDLGRGQDFPLNSMLPGVPGVREEKEAGRG
jgi:hypothetical protein